MMTLEQHGPDTYVGIGPSYPWGGLYGGQIVAQSLRAAAATVEPEFQVHSLHAYFIRTGDSSPAHPLRGRPAAQRPLVRHPPGRRPPAHRRHLHHRRSRSRSPRTARRSRPRPCARSPARRGRLRDVEPGVRPPVRAQRRAGPGDGVAADDRAHGRRPAAARRAPWPTSPTTSRPTPSWRCTRTARRTANFEEYPFFSASLDHSIWFHRPFRADEWLLHDLTAHALMSSRGLAVGHVFTEDGLHVATVSQEALLRASRR